MRCTTCGFDSPEGMKFCGGCGGPLKAACPGCGEQNPPSFKFCGHCGVPLAAAVAAQPPERDTAERRQLTVMFCDLVGSTALSAQLDPEDLRDVIQGYQQMVGEEVGRYAGHVAQHLGDGILIYFGYPRAHEDDARRAVHAALGVVGAMAGLSERLGQRGVELAVRVGVHTGPVVAGELGEGETGSALALGQTPNVAAGLEGAAAANGIVLSAATHELVEGFFAFRPLGPKKLKSTSKPVEVYEVVGESGVRDRFELAVSQGLGPLIGRRRELVLLRDRFYSASDGQGQVVEVSGLVGVGKSRQVYELRKAIAMMPHQWLTCRTSRYARQDDFHPFIEHLSATYGLHHEDSPEEKLCKIRAGTERLGAFSEIVPFVARLLAVPFPGREADGARGPADAPELEPGQIQEKLSELLLTTLRQLAGERPLVFFVEDLQWADGASVAFLEQLVSAVVSVPILVVLTYRPAFHPPWPERLNLTRLRLDRLGDEEEEMMVEEVTGHNPLPAELLGQILEKADGIPLYIEELTRMVLESDRLRETEDGYQVVGDEEISLGIPTSLQDALMARLDHDPEAKEIAQLAAALGREFGFEVLRSVSRLGDEALERRLERLVAEDLLIQFGEPPLASYSFRHALIREAAYESVLRSTRPQYHLGMAEALIELAPELAESDPALVAHHLRKARQPERAAGYWLQAGRQALQHSDYRLAKAHLDKGLEAALALPPGERETQEIALQCACATAWASTAGWQAPEVAEAYARAHELCRDQRPELFWVLKGRWMIDLMRPDLEVALVAAADLLELATALGDPELLMSGHLALGGAHLFHGDLALGRGHLEKALDQDIDGSAPMADGWLLAASGVVASSWLSLALWHLGYPDQALAESVAAVGEARRLRHPFSLAYALSFGAWLHLCRREEDLVLENAEELLSLAEKHDLSLAVWGRFFLSVRGIRERIATNGSTAGSRGLRKRRAREPDVGTALGATSAATLTASLAAMEGRMEEGANSLEAALEAGRRSGEVHWQAEVHRCRGELLLTAAGDDAARRAEASFQQALDTARHQGSRSLQLRAATSLARLWQRDRREEARRLLAPIHGSFTEGHDTTDLEDAAALLTSLSS